MTGQAFLVCEVIYTGWKQIPGSVCILPRFVPISLVVSKLPHSLVLPSVCCLLTGLILSDAHIGRHPSRYALDGMMNLVAFFAGLGYLSLINLDLQGCPRSGAALPLIFYLLHVRRNDAGLAGARSPGDRQTGSVGRDFRYVDLRSPEFQAHQGHFLQGP